MKEKGFDLYKKGITVTGERLNDSLADVFTVLEDVKVERSVAQQDLWNDLHFTKLPKFIASEDPTEKELHLSRPSVINETPKIMASWGRYNGK